MKRNLLILFAVVISSLQAYPQLIVAGEYFWDLDPGLGNATYFYISAVSETDITVPFSTAGLKDGVHILGFRTQDDSGRWGETYHKNIAVHQYTGAEYFWENDPGAGNGIPLALSSSNFDLDIDLPVSSVNVPPGRRTLGVRTKGIGGVWSPPETATLYVPTLYTEGEFFWDTDPGVGNANSFSLAPQSDSLDQTISLNSGNVVPGVHYLYSRVRGENGSFGTTYKKRFYISRNIVGGEFFWDVDPGIGNGTPLAAIAVGDSVQVCGEVNTIGFPEGVYMFYVRTISEDGQWSHTQGIEVSITANTVQVGCVGDFDLSGNVNTSDLLLFLTAFGQSGICSFDITGDFIVNTADLLLFLTGYGTTCPD